MSYLPTIGLEVHAELLTKSKMFCGCAVVDQTSASPNSSVCEICTGMPGTLPVINQRAVEFALRVALALHCQIAATSVFARKNYFYPDLPKGFQISQYELPLAQDGWFEIETPAGSRRIGIRRVHLEEDTGKLIHHEDHSLIDYNRCGIPLLEIVSQPDLHSVEEVRAYSGSLRSLLRYLGVNSGDMQKGVIRFEANVSLSAPGSDSLGTRTEIKNLNSFRAVTRAVAYEIERQQGVLERGERVAQETRGWDEDREITLPQRSKEEAHDYRYFPEPDLPPLVVDEQWIRQIQSALPELPEAKRARFERSYGLSPYSAALLTAEPAVADFYERAVAAADRRYPDRIANWTTGELFGLLNQASLEIQDSRVAPEMLARIVDMVETGRISAASGKELLAQVFQTGAAPAEVVAEQDLEQLSDPQSLQRVAQAVLSENPQQVSQYLSGKTAIYEWFVGQTMQLTKGKANPAVVRSVLKQLLADLESHPE